MPEDFDILLKGNNNFEKQLTQETMSIYAQLT